MENQNYMNTESLFGPENNLNLQHEDDLLYHNQYFQLYDQSKGEFKSYEEVQEMSTQGSDTLKEKQSDDSKMETLSFGDDVGLEPVSSPKKTSKVNLSKRIPERKSKKQEVEKICNEIERHDESRPRFEAPEGPELDSAV